MTIEIATFYCGGEPLRDSQNANRRGISTPLSAANKSPTISHKFLIFRDLGSIPATC